MSFTSKYENWTEAEEAFYQDYSEDLEEVFSEQFSKLISTSSGDSLRFYLTVEDKMFWEFVNEEYNKFQDCALKSLTKRNHDFTYKVGQK